MAELPTGGDTREELGRDACERVILTSKSSLMFIPHSLRSLPLIHGQLHPRRRDGASRKGETPVVVLGSIGPSVEGPDEQCNIWR